MKTHKVTQQQVAEEAGVTRATVSYVLTGRAEELSITPEVVKRVERAAARLGYLPNLAARALVSGRSRTLGLMLGGNPFWGLIAEGVESAALDAGYDVLLMRGQGDAPASGLTHLQQGRVDAVIALGYLSPAAVKAWETAPVPPVVMPFSGAVALPGVDLDPEPGLVDAVHHLVSLGHRRFAWLEPDDLDQAGGTDRTSLVAEACKEQGATLEVVRAGKTRKLSWLPVDEQIAGWSKTMSGTLESPLRATAVLCWNDAMALGLCAWLRERGGRVPEDVSVVGFDDWLAAAALPPLTTVSFEFRRIGAEAARLAMQLAEGTLSAAEARKTVVYVPSRFVARKSTGPGEHSRIVSRKEVLRALSFLACFR
jgi:DNA-binding LacI/PurR family transcriptional regulator